MTKKKSHDRLMEGLLLGGAIGTMIGLLLSPRQGKENRQMLKKSVEALPELTQDLTANLKSQVKSLSNTTLNKWDDTVVRFHKAIAAGIEASQQEGKKDHN